ncbi:protein eva-1 homolog C isoform X2 [Clupea harengus]|uniref:Protein eva-1 homolog C isoform X2 n=1 Tax=Clupea harengus TaxID=7950 RepID=A0A6P8FWI9_CLUHA|nr:protein eva-1 homolog C isoform X2 [Clupea harengus]
MPTMVHVSSHRCHWCLLKIMYGILLLWAEDMNALSDFSKYLTKIITSQSAYGCDGEMLRLQCPRHSTVSILSAHYGLAEVRFCPSLFHTALLGKHLNHSCSASTALQLLSECQGHRDCDLLVNHHVFGRDPCPGGSKYLHVTYKCKPTEHKRKVGCEGESITLHCKLSRVLIIYSAVYGRQMEDKDVCSSHYDPPFECLYFGAAHTVLKKCNGKQRCLITINDQTFRNPCPPRSTKHLTILYSCVPQVLMKEVEPNIFNPTLVPQHTNDRGVIPNVKGSKLPENHRIIVSNSLVIYGYIKEHQDKAALFFISSVCVGLLILLLAVSLRLSCHMEHTWGGAHLKKRLLSRTEETSEEEEEEDDEEDDEVGDEGSMTVMDSSLLSVGDRKPLQCWEEVTYTTEAAELMERIERRELVIQEIWMNSYLNGTSCGHP